MEIAFKMMNRPHFLQSILNNYQEFKEVFSQISFQTRGMH